jgi:hypothetical protein
VGDMSFFGSSGLLSNGLRAYRDKFLHGRDEFVSNHDPAWPAWKSWASEMWDYPEWRALLVVVILSGIVALARALGRI